MSQDFAIKTSKSGHMVIFSDLDGTLLDPVSYSWAEAEEALNLCKRSGVPVVLASSKTRAEMETLRTQMSLQSPFIVENGGGIYLPVGAFRDLPPGLEQEKEFWKWPQGPSYKSLAHALREIRKQLKYEIRGFSEMTIAEISRLTDLGNDMAEKAARREFDEPFVILNPRNPDRKALHSAAARKGFFVTEGGRFFHLKGPADKGTAMDRVVSLYRTLHGKVVSMALGDSPNDFPMLEKADYPILVRSKADFPELADRIPHLMVTREKGPKGWNEAVLHTLETRRKEE